MCSQETNSVLGNWPTLGCGRGTPAYTAPTTTITTTTTSTVPGSLQCGVVAGLGSAGSHPAARCSCSYCIQCRCTYWVSQSHVRSIGVMYLVASLFHKKKKNSGKKTGSCSFGSDSVSCIHMCLSTMASGILIWGDEWAGWEGATPPDPSWHNLCSSTHQVYNVFAGGSVRPMACSSAYSSTVTCRCCHLKLLGY